MPCSGTEIQSGEHGPVAKIATGELDDKERGAEVGRTVHRGRYIITERSLREFQVGGSVFRAVVRLECFTNSSADIPGGRTYNFYQRADLFLSFLTVCLSPSLFSATWFLQPHRGLPYTIPSSPSGFRLKRLLSLSSLRGKYEER